MIKHQVCYTVSSDTLCFPPLIFLDLASPVTFTQPLQNQQAEEGGSVTLSCEVSKPNTSVQWKKAGTVLRPSDKYRMRQEGSLAELTIHNLSEADAGEYTCDTGDQQTTAAVHLKGGALRGEELGTAWYRARDTGLSNLAAKPCPVAKENHGDLRDMRGFTGLRTGSVTSRNGSLVILWVNDN